MSEDPNRKSDKAGHVRAMFGAIAHRYDFLNHLLSANIDKGWRRTCVREVSLRLAKTPPPDILDVGCGTADLSLAFASLGRVVGCDFSHPMLAIGRDKVTRRDCGARIRLVEGDALALPFPDDSFDAVVSAFVLRNLADSHGGLLEMKRVLRRGGVLGIMDFSMPAARMLGGAYRLYFHKILPRLGALISGVGGAYDYLPESVESFPRPDELRLLVAGVGFDQVEYRLLAGGIAVLLLARAG